MSVLKSERKESPFETRDYVVQMRKEVTKLVLQDFGYRQHRFQAYIDRAFNNRKYFQLSQDEKVRYDYMYHRLISFNNWFIQDERKVVIDCLRNVIKEVNLANSIYPVSMYEVRQRRLHQELAIGYCYTLTQELQYIIETLPVDINKYKRFALMIDHEINLIKGWRTADNKTFKPVIDKYNQALEAISVYRCVTAANFANVNNNGNANYNNASNSNGVRPDFEGSSKRSVESQEQEKGEMVSLDDIIDGL